MQKKNFGIEKIFALLISFAFFTIVVASPVLAVHDSVVTITPGITNCQVGNTFTVNVENSASSADSIFEVRIYDDSYNDTYGIVSFECGPAPAGWQLFDYANKNASPYYGYCEYKTQQFGSYIIKPGQDLDFTFDALMFMENCYSRFLVSTLDNKLPVGEHEYHTPEVKIDCVNPVIQKEVGVPKISGIPPVDWWVTQNTDITLTAYDTTKDNQCNLGIDYCQYKITVDGVPGDWIKVENGEELEWTFNFKEDSEHYLEVECYDKAGNKATLKETDKVDTTPPTTTKSFNGPQKVDGEGVEWIDGVTTVELTAEDGGKICAIGVNNTYWRNTLVADENCWNAQEYCKPCIGGPSQIVTDTLFWDKFETNLSKWTYHQVDRINDAYSHDNYYARIRSEDNDDGYMYASINTIGYQNITLTYWARVRDLENGDYLRVEWRVDNSGGWTGLNDIGYSSTSWHNYTHVLGASAGNKTQIQIRYRCDDGSSVDYCQVDDVVVTGKKSTVSGCGDWNVYTGPIGGISESCHMLEFYSTDLIGNTEAIKTNCFFVDKTPPEVSKRVGEPTKEGNDPVAFPATQGVFHWVTQQTPIDFMCSDQLPHPSSGEKLCFKVSYDQAPGGYNTGQYCAKYDGTMNAENYCCVSAGPNDSGFTFDFDEDSVHDLEYYCKDAVEKKSPVSIQYYKVDTAYPTILKTMLGVQGKDYLGACPPQTQSDVCYVADNGVGGVHVAVNDNGPICAVGVDECEYSLWWLVNAETCRAAGYNFVEGRCLVGSDNFDDETDILFHEDSTHVLEITCDDELDNEMPMDTETFLVDSTPPVTTKTYGQPFFSAGDVDWATSQTPITLTATDNKVGVDKIYWAVNLVQNDNACWNPDEFCNPVANASYSQQTGNSTQFTIPQQSCHVIQYYAVDKLGNTEQLKHQCVFIDNSPPAAQKTVGDPKLAGDNKTFDWWVTQQTPITLDCADPEPHPVQKETMCYRVSFDDNPKGYLTAQYCAQFGGQLTEGWCCAYVGNPEITMIPTTYTLHFTEDSNHNLEYYCKDKLGNAEAPHIQWYKVDTTPPTITKVMQGPYYGQCPPVNETCYVDTATSIDVQTNDGGPICAVDNVTCRWRYYVNKGDWSDWYTTFPITFPEECYHMLQIECKDALGNTIVDEEQFIVDKSPPVISKEYGTPFFTENGVEWITSATPITLSAYDPEPHPSGMKSLQYRVTLMGSDEPCFNREACQEATGTGEWTPYMQGYPFTIGKESCHLIEVVAKDNVDKTNWHKQCVFVDNSAPVPNKTVGNPKEPWDGKDANFYEIEEFCSTPGNCWKVTILTPISLECIDAQPHPVDHETVCFKVELDAEDETDDYCMGGTMGDNGYCCMPYELPEFTFGEISEHNLKYYCKDALGNTGPIDDEKFKVEETAFEIELNKKWNLISTPVALLDDSMDEVFEDVADTVESVWTYDGVTDQWYVYTPDNNSMNDNLNTMLPGWGYWVLSNDDDLLVIGGSLMSPAKTPPSKTIVHGWNLIGYYGTQWAPNGSNGYLGYYGPPQAFDPPLGNGKQAYCALYSIGDSIWDKEFASLISYWEPLNPTSWNTHSPSYVGLTRWDNMDPGAGYWMFATEEGIYVPSTACVS